MLFTDFWDKAPRWSQLLVFSLHCFWILKYVFVSLNLFFDHSESKITILELDERLYIYIYIYIWYHIYIYIWYHIYIYMYIYSLSSNSSIVIFDSEWSKNKFKDTKTYFKIQKQCKEKTRSWDHRGALSQKSVKSIIGQTVQSVR